MKTKVIGTGLSAALLFSACSSSTTGSSAKHAGGKASLTVWVFQGDYTPAVLHAIDTQFTAQTGAHVSVQNQSWTDSGTKISTALATSSPPDIIDIGNTQVSSYASNGGLADLTKDAAALRHGGTWLAGLVNPATIKGRLYAVPAFAGDRAAIYNKRIWAAAGITRPPATYGALKTDLGKIKADHHSKTFSAFYLPAENWIASMQWVWDLGGTIATQSASGAWQPGLGSPAALRGLASFKAFQNAYSSPASQLQGNTTNDQDTFFANGSTATILGTASEIGVIKQDNPHLSSADIGVFPMPGLSGRTQTVMLGGSDWGIAERSPNQSLALKWIQIATSPNIERKYIFGQEGWVPNTQQQLDYAIRHATTTDRAFFTAARRSAATPAASSWTTIQDDNSIANLFGEVASGRDSVKSAASSFDSHLSTVLNANS